MCQCHNFFFFGTEKRLGSSFLVKFVHQAIPLFEGKVRISPLAPKVLHSGTTIRLQCKNLPVVRVKNIARILSVSDK
jgi:hypothetical protein